MEDEKPTVMRQVGIGLNSDWSREHLFALVLTVVLTLGFAVAVSFSGGNATTIALFPLVAVLLLIISNFELALAALVISLFVDVHASLFSSAVVFSFLFALSFVLRFRSVEWREFANPMTVPILIYGACIVPSFINAAKPLISLLMLFNVVAFLIVLYSLVAGVKTHNDLRRAVTIYLCVALINALDVFIQSLFVQKRVFGFSGIMFVDYCALSVCVTAAMSVVSRGKRRVALLLLSSVFAVALILTQTRNVWLSALITLSILVGYLILHPEVVGLSRKRLVAMTVIGFMVFAGAGALAIFLNPQIEKRGTELADKPGYGIDEAGKIETSIGSRLLIWDTALNAFRAHPVIGIGVYAFPYSSHWYYTIPKFLYTRFVARLTPHQTHLAVLAETGIVGVIGFLIFVVAALKHAFQAIKSAKDDRSRRYAFVGAIGLVYCTVSMLFTDAWLWGQGIVLLGLVIGLLLANRRIGVSISEDGVKA